MHYTNTHLRYFTLLAVCIKTLDLGPVALPSKVQALAMTLRVEALILAVTTSLNKSVF